MYAFSPDLLQDMYVRRGLTLREMSAALGCARRTLWLAMQRCGIERRPTGRIRGKTKTGQGSRYVEKRGYIVERVLHLGKNRRVHRLVMEKALGRPLLRQEIVHHVNGDKADNRLENLQLMSQAKHMRIHKAEKSDGRGGRCA